MNIRYGQTGADSIISSPHQLDNHNQLVVDIMLLLHEYYLSATVGMLLD